MSLRLEAPNALPRKSSLQSVYLTTCKQCRFGIYQGQPYVWSRDPMGMVHTECAGGQP